MTLTRPFPEVVFLRQFPQTSATKIVQNYRIIRGKETAAFQVWIEKIEQTVLGKLIPTLASNHMMLPSQVYRDQGIQENLSLAKFQILIV